MKNCISFHLNRCSYVDVSQMRILSWISSLCAFEINENESKISVLKCMAIVKYYSELSSLVVPGCHRGKWLQKCRKSDGCGSSNGSNGFHFLQSIFNVFKCFISVFFSLDRWRIKMVLLGLLCKVYFYCYLGVFPCLISSCCFSSPNGAGNTSFCQLLIKKNLLTKLTLLVHLI